MQANFLTVTVRRVPVISKDAGKLSYSAQGFQCFPRMQAISLSVHWCGAAGVKLHDPSITFILVVCLSIFTIHLNLDLQRLEVASGMRLDSTLREHRYRSVSHFNCSTYPVPVLFPAPKTHYKFFF